jgi:hypothetical protein
MFVPSVLLWLCNASELFHVRRMFPPADQDVYFFGFLLITDLILAGPGLTILSYVLLRRLRKRFLDESEEFQRKNLVYLGVFNGISMSSLNFPGYLALIHLTRGPMIAVRLMLIFAFTGGLCGAWVGWQAFKERHPGYGFLPRLNLTEWIFFYLSSGAVLWAFMPFPQ